MAKIIKNGIEYNHSTTNFEIGETPPLDPSVELWFDTSEEMPMADYIVERGTTDGWEWEKWASGKILANKQGAMPSGTFASDAGIAHLITSFSIPASFITLNFGKLYVVDSFCTATFSTQYSNSTTIAFNVFSSYPYSNTNSMSYRCEISGTWK